MNFKKVVNPSKVYEGWFESYFIRPWFRKYSDFSGGETRRDFLFSLLGWAIVTLGIAGILLGLVGLLGPEIGFPTLEICGGIWIAYSIVPFIALVKRTSNGGDAKQRHPKFLGIDILQVAASMLFFLFGLFIMITTLNSEMLNPDPRMEDEEEVKIEGESIVEEPIFTYQDASTEVKRDTAMVEPEVEDPDMLSPDESFDPTIATQPDMEKELPDSLYF